MVKQPGSSGKGKEAPLATSMIEKYSSPIFRVRG
jgi:hypothetical protein